MDFLREYKVLPLAIAFIMGVAITALIQSLVNDIIMPLITPLLPGEDWKAATLNIGPIVIRAGAFLSSLINFVIIAFVVFLMAKIILRKEKVEKI